VGVIIGSAFGKVVEKFAELLTSSIGLLLGALFSKIPYASELQSKFKKVTVGQIDLTPLISQVLNLILVGFALFLFIKLYNRLLAKPAPAPPEPTATEKLLIEIRDELKKRGS
jgi:large conductance mechanosensitive channel